MLTIRHFDAAGRSVPGAEDYHRPDDPLARRPIVVVFREPMSVEETDHVAKQCQDLFPGKPAVFLPAEVRFVTVQGRHGIVAGHGADLYFCRYRIVRPAMISLPLTGPVGSEIAYQSYDAHIIPVHPWGSKHIVLFRSELPDSIGADRARELIRQMVNGRHVGLPLRSDGRCAILCAAFDVAMVQPVTDRTAKAVREQPVYAGRSESSIRSTGRSNARGRRQ